MEINKIHQGDCIEGMKQLDANSVDAIITDPPYGLEFMGKEWDSFKDKGQGDGWQVAGKPSLDKFEGKNDWHSKPRPAFRGHTIEHWRNLQSFCNEWATECLRVLKPGGFLLSFGGTRTYHRLVCGIEDAGFEIRDTIMWCYGSGFPKSLNIGKQIDKIQGNEREVIGVSKNEKDFRDVGKKVKEEIGIDKLSFGTIENAERKELEITKGNSEWEGWGTALKPSNEPIVVARKPLSEKNVALNVLKWGTGGINIDGCRIGNEEISTHNAPKGTFAGGELDRGSDTESYKTHQGRFPANIILECTCDKTRTKEEKISGGFGAMDIGMSDTGKGKTQNYNPEKSKSKQGSYQIHTNPNCPCRMLDEQSGVSKSSGGRAYQTTSDKYGDYANKIEKRDPGFGDKGGVSRFFYCVKASKRERSFGTDSFIKCEVLKVICKENNLTKEERLAELLVDMDTLQGKVIEEDIAQNKKDIEWNTVLFGKKLMEKYQKDIQFITKMETNSITPSIILNWLKLLLTKEYTLDANSLKENGGNPVGNVEKSKELTITINEKLASALGVKDVVSGMQLKIRLKEGNNFHPTCKPIKLMEYLIKLVSKEDSLILDPFAGSGSTLIAARKLSRNFIGIEKEQEYIEIANARLKKYMEQKKLGDYD